MQFSQIGKLIVKFAAPESTNATAELYSPGLSSLFAIFISIQKSAFYNYLLVGKK